MRVGKFFATFLFFFFVIVGTRGVVDASFDDVDKDYIYADAINTLASQKVFKGYTNGKFKPKENVSRGQMATVAVRAAGLDFLKYASPVAEWVDCDMFPDVTIDSPHKEDICIAASFGFLKGYSDGTYKPDKKVSDREAYKIIIRTLTNVQIDKDEDLVAYQKQAEALEVVPYTIAYGRRKGSPRVDAKRGEIGFMVNTILNMYKRSQKIYECWENPRSNASSSVGNIDFSPNDARETVKDRVDEEPLYGLCNMKLYMMDDGTWVWKVHTKNYLVVLNADDGTILSVDGDDVDPDSSDDDILSYSDIIDIVLEMDNVDSDADILSIFLDLVDNVYHIILRDGSTYKFDATTGDMIGGGGGTQDPDHGKLTLKEGIQMAEEFLKDEYGLEDLDISSATMTSFYDFPIIRVRFMGEDSGNGYKHKVVELNSKSGDVLKFITEGMIKYRKVLTVSDALVSIALREDTHYDEVELMEKTEGMYVYKIKMGNKVFMIDAVDGGLVK